MRQRFLLPPLSFTPRVSFNLSQIGGRKSLTNQLALELYWSIVFLTADVWQSVLSLL